MKKISKIIFIYFYYTVYYIPPKISKKAYGQRQPHLTTRKSAAFTQEPKIWLSLRSPFPSSIPAKEFLPTTSLHLGVINYIGRRRLTNTHHSFLSPAKCTIFWTLLPRPKRRSIALSNHLLGRPGIPKNYYFSICSKHLNSLLLSPRRSPSLMTLKYLYQKHTHLEKLTSHTRESSLID